MVRAMGVIHSPRDSGKDKTWRWSRRILSCLRPEGYVFHILRQPWFNPLVAGPSSKTFNYRFESSQRSTAKSTSECYKMQYSQLEPISNSNPETSHALYIITNFCLPMESIGLWSQQGVSQPAWYSEHEKRITSISMRCDSLTRALKPMARSQWTL